MMMDETTVSLRTAAGDAVTDLVLEVFRLNGALLAAGDAMTRDLGLTSARWQVLGALEQTPMTVSQVAREMGLTRQSVQRLANELVADGLLAQSDNPQHKRAPLLQLTALGRRRLATVNARQAGWADALAAAVPAAEIHTATTALQALRGHVNRT